MSYKARVINIMAMPPPYSLYYNDPRPVVNWDTADGRWVGIWGYDWPDLIGNEILKLTKEFAYEVWQPDLRADRIYAYTFENGSVHKLFPAATRNRLFGFKVVKELYSTPMVRALSKQIDEDRIIVHLNGDPLLYRSYLGFRGTVPIITSYHGVIHMPITRLYSHTKNIPSKLNHVVDHLWFVKNVNRVDYVTYQNERNIEILRRFYHGDVEKVTMGCDFEFWKPGDRLKARAVLGLPRDKAIFFTALRLVEGKQIDRLIDTFTQLSQKHDFMLLIAGHGDSRYEKYLKDLASVLLSQGKIAFVGYVRGELLRTYYRASNYYILTSITEGASVSVMNAFACGIPVISTRTGHTAELLEKYKCGVLLDVCDYRSWWETLDSVLDNRKVVLILDRNIAQEYYDWQNIARKFIYIYRQIIDGH